MLDWLMGTLGLRQLHIHCWHEKLRRPINAEEQMAHRFLNITDASHVSEYGYVTQISIIKGCLTNTSFEDFKSKSGRIKLFP